METLSSDAHMTNVKSIVSKYLTKDTWPTMETPFIDGHMTDVKSIVS